jgi:hypothetical protein
MAKTLAPLTSGATELAISGDMEGGVQYFNEGLKKIMPTLPEGIQEKIKEAGGSDHNYDASEIAAIKLSLSQWGEKTGGKRTQASFMVDGVPTKGSFDEYGNYYDANQNLITGKVEPFAVGRTDADVQAFGGGPGDKVSDRLAREVMGGAENLLSSVDRISTQVDKMSQSSMGLPGTVAKVVDNAVNAVSGFAEMMPNASAQINGQEVQESMLLDAELYRDTFEGPAADNAALQANAIGLAYSLARAANPDGRISDADVRHQLKRVLLQSSSKAQIQSALKEVKRSILTNVSNHLRVYGYTKTKEGKSGYDRYMDMLDKMDAEESRGNGSVPADYDGPRLTDGAGNILILSEDGKSWVKP